VVKVLDFGLAQLADASAATAVGPSPMSMSPTITSPAMVTGAGVLLGTAACPSNEFAVVANGQKFLVATVPGASDSTGRSPLTVVVNWTAALKK
jgi:hypothetical protein